MSLPLKKCPSCKFWWFDRTNYGCTKQGGRVTYPSTMQWEVECNRITCGDFRSRKMYEYLLQKNGAKQSNRLIREEVDGEEIENEKVSKAKRMIIPQKKKKKKDEVVLDSIKVNKPKRMIRIENHDWLE